MTITTRPMEDSERPYVLATWHRTYVSARSPHPRQRAARERVVNALSEQPVLVAVDSDLPAGRDIAGWCCYTKLNAGGVVHFVYVRHERRGRGIARALLAAAGITLKGVVHHTLTGPSFPSLRQRFNLRHIPPETIA